MLSCHREGGGQDVVVAYNYEVFKLSKGNLAQWEKSCNGLNSFTLIVILRYHEVITSKKCIFPFFYFCNINCTEHILNIVLFQYLSDGYNSQKLSRKLYEQKN